MKKLLPLVLLLIGLGAGVGAGIFLRPDVRDEEEHSSENGEITNAEKTGVPNKDDHGGKGDHAGEGRGTDAEVASNEYAKLNNQFVVPIVSGDKVVALVVLALSIEVSAGGTEIVYQREPKLRDSFLQVLFDHANIGGFEGNFTNAEVLGRLRSALNEAAQKDLGKDVAKDVLIEEIARQDY